MRCVSAIIVRATAPVSVATVKRYRPEPASESVPLTRVRAASVDKSQYSHSGSQRELVTHLGGKRHADLCFRVGARQVAMGNAHVILGAFQITCRGLGDGNAAVLTAWQPMAIESCGLPSAI